MIKKLIRNAYVCLLEKSKTIDGVKTHYLFYKNKCSNVLLVGFSACENKANYNYVKTLNGVKVNKLFIKDDYSENKLGSYYLGGGTQDVEEAIKKLIQIYIDKCNASTVIFIGSSKGGYAALNFSSYFKDSIVIIGAPQYFLGDYLKNSNMISQMNFIMGDNQTRNDVELLNKRLQANLKLYSSNIRCVYLNFSNNEHTYQEHIRFLIDDLIEFGVETRCEVDSYFEHGEIAFHYPGFLKRTIQTLLEGKL